MDDLVARLVAGDRRALARLLSAVEDERPGVEAALAALYPRTGRAWIVGITGSPGTGKSTLVSALARAFRAREKTVGVLAVDPTSPFSGGAILGDRIRMRDLSGDPGVFIRSMATRGHLGGLARTTLDAARVLDAAGLDVILIETVGAGQSEVDIARAAYTTIVVEAPGLGDDVQAIKAGILEIADVLVVNKADRPGAASTVRALRTMLELGHPASRGQFLAHHGRLLPAEPAPAQNGALWLPPVLETVASEGRGVEALADAVERHRVHLADRDGMRQMHRQQLQTELYERLRDALMARLLRAVAPDVLSGMIDRVEARELAPHEAVQTLLAQVDR